MFRLWYLILLFYIMISASMSFSKHEHAKFKSLNCECYDKSYGEFSICNIKAVSRTMNLVNIAYNLRRTMEGGATLHVQFFKRESGWHPYLYDFNLDVCKFFAKRYNLISILCYRFLEPFTNVNHTCPYKAGTTLILQNFAIDMDLLLSLLPLDNGEYAVRVGVFVKNILKASINGSGWYYNYMKSNR